MFFQGLEAKFKFQIGEKIWGQISDLGKKGHVNFVHPVKKGKQN